MNGNVYYSGSKAQALLTAVQTRWAAGTVLVWHLGLLKLLPFMRLRHAKVALFLHGVEAWRSQGWLTRQLLRRVDLFLSNTEYTWRRFTSFNPGLGKAAHRIDVFPKGLPGREAAARRSRPHRRPLATLLQLVLTGTSYQLSAYCRAKM